MNATSPALPHGDVCRFACHSKLRSFTGWLMVALSITAALILFSYISSLQRREHAAAAAEQSLVSLLRETNTAMVEIDDNSTIMKWNASASTLFGYSAEEAQGKPLDILMPDLDIAQAHRERVHAGFANVLPRVMVITCTAKQKSGKLIAVSLTVFVPSRQHTAIALINNLAEVTPVVKPISQEARSNSEAAKSRKQEP